MDVLVPYKNKPDHLGPKWSELKHVRVKMFIMVGEP